MGIEPTTPTMATSCSPSELRPQLVDRVGIEPTAPSLQGKAAPQRPARQNYRPLETSPPLRGVRWGLSPHDYKPSTETKNPAEGFSLGGVRFLEPVVRSYADSPRPVPPIPCVGSSRYRSCAGAPSQLRLAVAQMAENWAKNDFMARTMPPSRAAVNGKIHNFYLLSDSRWWHTRFRQSLALFLPVCTRGRHRYGGPFFRVKHGLVREKADPRRDGAVERRRLRL